jgi:transcriptional repressor NrdR
MRCPLCGALDTQVRDSRPSEDHAAIRRRRSCTECGARFTTFERVQLRELTIVKRDGRRVPLDREKLARSIGVALRKRSVGQERIEQLVSSIVRTLENRNDAEISSQDVGSLVMEGLKALDGVAYIRYASVYRDFREAKDFQRVLGELGEGFVRAAEEK